MAKFLATAVLSALLASTAANAEAATKPAGKAPGDAKEYCLTFSDDTGSHLTRTECRTKKEWKQLGVDVDDLGAKNADSGGLA